MRLPRNKTTLLWKTAIRELSSNGVNVDPEDVVWLWQLADRVYFTAGRRLLFTRAPMFLPTASLGATRTSPLVLYPITLQGIDWLLAVSVWWKGSDMLPAAFACAHSDGEKHAIFHETDHGTIEATVASWASTLPCTPEDLRHAVQLQTETPDVSIETDTAHTVSTSAVDWGELLALLSGVYHVAPWDLLMRPFCDIEEMLDKMPRIAALHGRVVEDQDRRKTLREFQEGVLYLKRTYATVTPVEKP